MATAAACTDNSTGSNGDDSRSIAVESSATTCKLSATSAPAGTLRFNVRNTGSDVTEFYLLAKNKTRIIGEIENVGPGITRNLVVRAATDTYFTRCVPGMKGDGITAKFTVTKTDGPQPVLANAALLDTAMVTYKKYVNDQVEALTPATRRFAAAVIARDDDAARAQYASARMHWEAIEPVAESFGDLDPRLDLREADLEKGQEWTGWHRLEKDLWPPAPEANDGKTYVPLTDAERKDLADRLVDDTVELEQRVKALVLSPDQLGNGAKELLDEVATGKVTGEEEIWSHTDLWDFQANVEGAREAFTALTPVLKVTKPALIPTLDERFAKVQALLDSHKVGDGWKYYDELDKDQIKALADAVNALGEPLSELTAATVS
ncbi:MAG: iron uptake system protein EfeO [Microthrixaceae bacterium]